MRLADAYGALDAGQLDAVLRSISLSKLKTYQLFERLKIRLHVAKLNNEALRKIGSRVAERIAGGDEELAAELGQAILISHMDLVMDVLNHLGIPHEDGFFSKEIDPASYLKEGWREGAYEALREKHPGHLLTFYLNHLSFELAPELEMFRP